MNLQQAAGARFDANYGFQKKQLNPSEIDEFDAFEVATNVELVNFIRVL